MDEQSERLLKLVNMSSDALYALCKNIWLRQIPRECSQNERKCLYFNIPENEQIPAVVLWSLQKQLTNIRKSAKVIEKIREIEGFVDKMEDDFDSTNLLDINQESFQDLLRHANALNVCQILIPKLGSIKHRVISPSNASSISSANQVKVRPVVDASFSLLSCHLEKGETYKLINSSDVRFWKIEDAGGIIQTVPSLFLEIDSISGEALLHSRVKRRLQSYVTDMITKTCQVIKKIGHNLNQDPKYLAKFTSNNLSQATSLLLDLTTLLHDTSLFIAQEEDGNAEIDTNTFLNNVIACHDQLVDVNIEKQLKQYKGMLEENENCNTIWRLSKLNECVNILKALLLAHKELKVSSKEIQMRFKKKKTKQRNSEDVKVIGTFRSVFELEVEMTETVKEKRERIVPSMRLMNSSSFTSIYSDEDSGSSSSIQRSAITWVHDIMRSEDVDLSTALYRGILMYSKGTFLNTSTGETCPIELAVSQGYVKMEPVSSKDMRHDYSSMGILRINNVKHPQTPFLIRSVRRPWTNSIISPQEAITSGILDPTTSIYRNLKTFVEMQLDTAVELGLVFTEPDECSNHSPEIRSREFLVNGVIDNRLKRVVSFKEAFLLEIVDKETGAFIDFNTQRRICPIDAIKQGLFITRLLDPEVIITSQNGRSTSQSNLAPEKPLAISDFKRLVPQEYQLMINYYEELKAKWSTELASNSFNSTTSVRRTEKSGTSHTSIISPPRMTQSSSLARFSIREENTD